MRDILRRIRRRADRLIDRLYPETVAAQQLHLGCGAVRLEGFCNVDVKRTEFTDVTADIRKLRGFRKSSADLIYACHVLEHFSRSEVPGILTRWRSILRPGGELRISVPDVGRLAKIYCDQADRFPPEVLELWVGIVYGGQTDRYDFHKSGFTFRRLSQLLTECGFENPREYPHEPHFVAGTKDASVAIEPFGTFISLNIAANRPES